MRYRIEIDESRVFIISTFFTTKRLEAITMIRFFYYIATIITIITMIAILTPLARAQDDVIMINVSYKVVLDPATGTRPPGATNMNINNAVTRMNTLMQSYSRGYQFRLIEIVDVGGLGVTTGPGRWFNTNFFDSEMVLYNGNWIGQGAAWKLEMEADAEANPATYVWRDNAINIYITNNFGGGTSSFPESFRIFTPPGTAAIQLDDREIVIIDNGSAQNGPLHLHEIGHYFDLYHTQGDICGECADAEEFFPPAGTAAIQLDDNVRDTICRTIPGDDGIEDTLPDLECWTQDQIANFTYIQAYATLSPEERNNVDDVFFNIMSYHAASGRLTELQLDKWANTANISRLNVVDGRTFTVQPEDSGFSLPLIIDSALPGDIVLFKPGIYDVTTPMTISKPMTLRATREGGVIIGGSGS
ncbi:MAG: hypothetical protein GY790_12880 [Bacteroidetes bacterium]|nr:hypothetical protein [Bacteroidota bacterium]